LARSIEECAAGVNVKKTAWFPAVQHRFMAGLKRGFPFCGT
jgi:hypothetical protein